MTDLNRAEEILSAEEFQKAEKKEENNEEIREEERILKTEEKKDNEVNIEKNIDYKMGKQCLESENIEDKQSEIPLNHKKVNEEKEDNDTNETNSVKMGKEQQNNSEIRSNDEGIQSVKENSVDYDKPSIQREDKENHCVGREGKKQSAVKKEESKRTSAVDAILLSVRKLTSNSSSDTSAKNSKKVGSIQHFIITLFYLQSILSPSYNC